MDLTQRLPSDDDEDDFSADRSRPVAKLHMFSGTYGPAQDFDIYPGQNIIGRHAKCDITLPAQSVSKKHAILDVEGDLHTISDCGSLNKTRRGKVAITPHVRYSVADGDFLMFADVACRYTIVKIEEEHKEDDVAAQTESEDDFLVPGTQATLAIEKTPGAAIRRLGRGAVLARDSGEEDENEEEGQSRLSEGGKGTGSSRDNYKVSAIGTFFSPSTDTFVPESDEEGDTSVSQSRLPSLNLRCDSDIDTPARRESLAAFSQSFNTSPTPTEKKVPLTGTAETSNRAESDGSVSKTVKDESPAGRKDHAFEEAVTEERKQETPDVRDTKGKGPMEEAAGMSGVNPGSRKDIGGDTTDTLQTHETKEAEAAEILNNDTDIEGDDDNSASNKGAGKMESAGVVPDSDTDIEDDAPTLTADAKKTGEGFHVDSDTDIEDDVATTSGAGEAVKQISDVNVDSETAVKGATETKFHLDSDTDVDEEEAISVSAGVKKRAAILRDSDTDVDEEEAISVSAGVKKRAAIMADSDTDVDEEEAISVSAGVKKRAAILRDSDTDVDEEEAISVSAGVKKRAAIMADSDTDVESNPTAGGEAKSKKIESSPDSDTDAEGNDNRSLKFDAKKGSVPFNLDSDTDVEDETTISPAVKKSSEGLGTDMVKTERAKTPTDIHTGAAEDIRAPRGSAEQNAGLGFHMDSDTDVEEEEDEQTESSTTDKEKGVGDGCDTENIKTGELIQTSETSIQQDDRPVKDDGAGSSAAHFHMDSDTDVEEDDSLTPGPDVTKLHGAEDEQSSVENDTGGTAGTSSGAKVTDRTPEDTPKTGSEGGDYDTCATQCYLEPEDGASDQPDEDNVAEEATQAFVFSSTWAEPDPFKRPADPIGVLQISPVHTSASEEETDDNVMAETQPYLCTSTPSAGDCIQETVQTDSECAETSRETQPLSHGGVSQDDTQPVSQYLATRPADETGTWLHLKREAAVCALTETVGEGRAQTTAEEGVTRSAAQDVTQPYTLNVLLADGDTTQSYAENTSALEEDIAAPFTSQVSCTEDSLHVPASNPADSSAAVMGGSSLQPDRLHEPMSEDSSTEPCGLGVLTEEAPTASDVESKEVSCSEGQAGIQEAEEKEGVASSAPIVEALEGPPASPSPHITVEVAEEQAPLEELVTGGKRRTRRTGEVEGKIQNAAKEADDGVASRRKRRNKTDIDAEPSTSGPRETVRKKRATRKSTVEKTTEEERKDGVGPEHEEVRADILGDDKLAASEQNEQMPSEKSMEQPGEDGVNDDKESSSGMQEDGVVEPSETTDRCAPEDAGTGFAPETGTVNEETSQVKSGNVESLEGGVEGNTEAETGTSDLRESEENEDGRFGLRGAKEDEEEVSSSTSERKRITRRSQGKAPKSREQAQEDVMVPADPRTSGGVDKEVSVNRRSVRGKGRASPRNVGDQEEVTEPAVPSAKLTSKRKTKHSKTEEETNEREENRRNAEGLPTSRRTRRNSKGEGAGEEKEEEEKSEDPPASRRTRRNSKGEGAREEKEEEEKSEDPPTSRRARRNSKGEGAREEKEEEEKSEDPPASRRTRRNSKGEGAREEKEEKSKDPPASRRTRRNSAGEGTNEQEEGKPEEAAANKLISRRTRKSSRDEEDKFKTGQETTDPIRKSRSAKKMKDVQDKQPNDEEAGNRGMGKITEVEGETSRRNRRECKENETVVPSGPNVSRRTRRNSKEEEVKEPAVLEAAEEPEKDSGEQTTRRGKRNAREDLKSQSSEAEQAPSQADTKSRKATSRTRRKKPAEDDENLRGEEVTEVAEQPASHEEEKSNANTGRSRRTKDVLPPPSTPVPSRKRGQAPKDGGREVKRKKSGEEETEQDDGGQEQPSPLSRGTRGHPRRLVAAAAEAEDGNDRGKGTSVPPPSPAGSGRQKSRAVVPAEVRTPRRTNRSTATVGSSSPYVPHQGAAPKVLFTGVVDSAGEETILALGGDIAESVFDCTHLVTDRVRRTVKFLCALARGVPIVTLDWIEKCKKSGCFLSPAGFLVNDAEQEKNFGFVLSESLQKAKRRPLFEGYEIHVTENVKPEPEHMKDIIRCAGATFLPKMPRTCKAKCVIVSCQEDASRWKAAPSAALITSAEFILSGILRQEANPTAYLLNPGTKDAAPTPAKRRR